MLVIFLNSRLGQYHRRFRAVSDSQLTKQGVKVIFNRPFRNPKYTTNLLIAISLNNKMQNLTLSG